MYKSIFFGALGALSLSLSASAIAIRVVEDSPSRFAFDVVWGAEIPAAPDDFAETGDSEFNVRAQDFALYGTVTADSRFGLQMFNVVFDWVDSRAFADSQLEFFDGTQALPLPGEAFGGRFVFGAPWAGPSETVPDGGSTGWLLGTGCVAVAACRRRSRSR